MKKTIYYISLAAVLAVMASCKGNCEKACTGKAENTKDVQCEKKSCVKDDKRTYSGIIPAADVSGIRYILTLDYDDDNPIKGEYTLKEIYIETDSADSKGEHETKKFKSEGDFTIESGTGNKEGKRYLKLLQDYKDSAKGTNAGPIYFEIGSDTTLTMVNSQLEPSANPQLNYTLKLCK